MTPAFGGQYSIQLSYGCFRDREIQKRTSPLEPVTGFIDEAVSCFNAEKGKTLPSMARGHLFGVGVRSSKASPNRRRYLRSLSASLPLVF